MRKSKISRAISVLAFTSVICSGGGVFAAVVNANDLDVLNADAKQKGTTPVVIHIQAVSLNDLKDIAGVKAKMTAKANLIKGELGQNAWEAGQWENGIGQLGLNVTQEGLKILQQSGNAVSFYPGKAWQYRTSLSSQDGRLEAIENALSAQGYADVVVTLNAEALEYDLGKDGSIAFKATPKSVESAAQNARALFRQLTASQASGKEAAAARFNALQSQASSNFNPEFTLRVTREGIEKLASSKEVRSLKLAGFADKRLTKFDEDAFAKAQKDGLAEIIITIRNPLAAGNLSKASFNAMVQSNKLALDAVLANAGVKSRLKDISIFGAMAGHVSLSELRALRSSEDARLLSVELNKPVASVQLTTSTVTANFPPAWAAGYRGAGQNIIVMDTGVQANHRFFVGASGASKVVFEGCFGTNGQASATPGGPLVNYESICPNPQGATGDSPLPQAGSAAPRLNCAGGSSPAFSACHHGTHVAGIAAGRNSSTFSSGFQGIANEANIVALQVFSFDSARVAAPTAFNIDLLSALQAAANAMNTSTAANPYTVNMSLSGLLSTSSCGFAVPAITTAVEILFNAGVPVVAATGNSEMRNDAIGFPACVPRIVKVGSMVNDTVGTTISSFTQIASPLNFPGDFFWMAPGGGNGTSVTSSINGSFTINGFTQSTAGISGTSQATPHVAGLYALVKAAVPGIPVNDVSNWIENNASQFLSPVCTSSALPCAPTQNIIFKRIRLPNF